MDALGRKSDPIDADYWRKMYFDVLAQNKKLREENTNLRAEMTTLRGELIETQRQLELTTRISEASASEAISPRMGDTMELSKSSVQYLLSLVCTSQSSINLSLSNMFATHNFKGTMEDTINQRLKDTLEPHVELFRIESLGEREEESIEILDSQSSADRMFEEFMVLGLSTYSKTTETSAEVLHQYPNSEFQKGS